MTIDKFRGDYGFLSNFYNSPFTYNEVKYKTVEHAYQAAKCELFSDFFEIVNCKTPSEAKRLGNKCKMRPSWNNYKLSLMETFVREKFRQNPFLKRKLLTTGDAELVEGNTWGDRWWGKVGKQGLNHLGRILMKVRDEFRKEK